MKTPGDRGTSSSQQCCSCDTTSSRCWCMDCNEALCNACVLAHRRVTVTRSHRILNQPQGNTSTPPIKFCRLHPAEPLKLFCFTCQQYTCRDCQLTAHMNHRYQFVREALSSMKKQVEEWFEPVRAQRNTVRQSLQDLQTRLEEVAKGETQLTNDMQQSYNTCLALLKTRMDYLMEEIKKVNESETKELQSRINELKMLQLKQDAVAVLREKAKDTDDLPTLYVWCGQIRSTVKHLQNQEPYMPPTMTLLQVITDKKSLETLMNFGQLKVIQIPFSVSSSSDAPSASLVPSPLTPSSATPLPENLPSSSLKYSSPVVPSTSSSSSLPLPTTASDGVPVTSVSCSPALMVVSSTQARPPPSSCPRLVLVSKQQKKTMGRMVVVQPASASVCQQPVPLLAGLSPCSTIVRLLPPSLVLKQPPTNPQGAHRVSCWTVGVPVHSPHFSMLLNQTVSDLPAKTLPAETLPADTLPGNALTAKTLPVDALTAKTLPADLLPAKTLPAKTLPADALPAKTLPAKTLPAKTLPADALPAKTLPADSLTAKTLPAKTLPAKTLPAKTLPADALPAKTLPADSLTAKTLPARTLPADLLPARTLPADLLPARTLPADLLPARTLPADLLPARTLPADLLPANTLPADALPANTLPADTLIKQQVPCVQNRNIISGPGCEQQMHPGLVTDVVPEQLLQITASTETFTSVGQNQADRSCAPPSGRPVCDGAPQSSSAEPRQKSPVVKAAADSACDLRVQPVTERQREPAEDKPTSTVSEETEPPPDTTDGDAKERSSVIEPEDSRLSHWQPRVTIFRLPLPPLQPGCPLPGFRLVCRDTEDEVYVETICDDSQSDVDDVSDDFGDFMEPLSSPESPVTLHTVSCSACGLSCGSIICLSCSRGYHRDCHIPPVGPDIWTEWICSLCQDLSDPADPYCSERPRSPSPNLSLMDQRRCESLLLHLKVEGCSQFSETGSFSSRLTSISERLNLRRAPSYKTTAEFLFDIWNLLRETCFLRGEDVVNKLQQSFHEKLMEVFGSENQPPLLKPANAKEGEKSRHSHEQHPNKGILSESRLKEARKRLGQFLEVRMLGAKRKKEDKTVSAS